MKEIAAVKGLSKYYMGNRAIENINISFYEGNVHALIGENGAGKSTLIKCLTGLVHPSGGEIAWHGKTVAFARPQQAIEKGIAAVHQELSLVDTMTVSQNIWLGHEPLGRFGMVLHDEMEEKTLELMEMLKINLEPGRLVEELHLADKQLVEILKVFSHDPQIMIFDEATSTLGEEQVEHLYEIISILREKGKSIIFVSHRMKEVFRFCNTCTIFKNGLQVLDAELAGLSEAQIVKSMTGYEVDDSFPRKLYQMDDSEKEGLGETVLEIRELSTESGLEDINLDIRTGEVLGIGGLQGHGQVELLNTMFGMEKCTKGRIALQGEDISLKRPLQAIEKGIFLVPQDRKTQGLFVELSAGENIVACNTSGISKNGIIKAKRERRDIDFIIDRLKVKLSHHGQIVKFLSGGNQQKIALGKWLLGTGKVMLLIEPTRGIDIKTKVEIYALLRELAMSGYAIVMSTNEIWELVGLCDRVAVLFEKRLATQLEGDEITEENILSAAFGKASHGGEEASHA